MLIDLLWRQPLLYFTLVVSVVISIILHELAHGFAAIWQGDDTPRVSGHMTLDPFVHMGGISLLLLALFGIAFGAMPVNPRNFRSRFGDSFVSLAGPLMNIALALICLCLCDFLRTRALLQGGGIPFHVAVLFNMARLNILLAIFNLLPVPPLDGYRVLIGLSRGFARMTANPFFHHYGFLILFFLLFSAGAPLFRGIDDLALRALEWLPF